jgi:zinc-binding in reverse transcriptase
MWKMNISLKIKFFVWLVRRNRVLIKINLRKRVGMRIHNVCFVKRMNQLIISLSHALLFLAFEIG